MALQRLAGQVAIVTGAGRGIGKAIAQSLASEGAHTVLTSRTAPEIHAVAETIRESGGKALAIAADVSDQRQVEEVVSGALKLTGAIDVLVNNAGIGVFKSVSELTVEDFDAMWNVNMRGVFLATKAVLPTMTRVNSGAIVNIASLAAKNTFKGGAGYCATKWGLRGFAGALMLEVRDHNIRVVTICPGSVETTFSPMNKRGATITQPEDVADAVVFAVTAPGRTMFSEIDVRPTRSV